VWLKTGWEKIRKSLFFSAEWVGQQVSEVKREFAESLGDKMTVSMNFVTERLAVGGLIGDAAGVDQLVNAGITHVVDMQAEFDDHTLHDPRLQILWLPQNDDGTPRPAKDILSGIEFAFQALDAPGPKVYFHCAAGHNRGPTMCYAVLRAFGFPQDTAITWIRMARPEVTFYTIKNYVDSVEAALKIR
jgi:Dual specificity phosphatase, catalytic domain